MDRYSDALPKGTILNGKSYTYHITDVLGQGSFGITYLATIEDESMKKLGADVRVTIKEFFMEKINGREHSAVTIGSQQGLYGEYKSKFLREAKNLAKMNHQHIVRVLEAFEANNTVYYAMEYLDGGSLDKYIADKERFNENEVISTTKEIGSALHYMHQHKMLHLDLKPANVMLRSNGEVVLIDFGLSKQYDEDGEPESSTKVGGGTPGYAPIEQASYHEGKDFPTTMDIYALGGTMFKMLTGHRPPEASEILNEGFPFGELLRNGVSQQTVEVVQKAMSPLKKDRYQTVTELLGELPNLPKSEEDKYESEILADKKDVIDISKPGQICLTNSTNLIEFSFSDNSLKPKGFKRYEIKVTPQTLSINTETPDGQKEKKAFFFSTNKWLELIKSINTLKLLALSGGRDVVGNNEEMDISLCAYIAESRYVNASTVGKRKMQLAGNVEELRKIIENTSNLKSNIQAPQKEKKEKKDISPLTSFLFVLGVLCAFIIAVFVSKGHKKDGSNDAIVPEEVNSQYCPDTRHPHYIDLGLPSKTKWACCNYGALSPKAVGDTIDFDDDTNIKEEWLPTIQEFEELENFCTIIDDNGESYAGIWYVGSNGNRVYFPKVARKSGDKIYYQYWATNEEDKTSMYYWGTHEHSGVGYVDVFLVRYVER